MAFTISGTKLTLEHLETIIQNKPVLEFSPEIQAKFKNSTSSADEENAALVRNYLQMQTAGFGPELSEDKVKLALVLNLQSLVVADSPDISFELLNRLLAFYNRDINPVILSQSTPTGQNAQLLLSMLGTGKVKYLNYELNAADILDIFSWQPLQLTSKTVTQVINKVIFPQAVLAYDLIKVKNIKEWLAYLISAFSQISEAELTVRNSPIIQFTSAFSSVQNLFESNLNNSYNGQATEINEGLSNLNQQLENLINSIANFTTETFENLISTSEPPATSGFKQALFLTQNIQSQINNSISGVSGNNTVEAINSTLINKLENALAYTEQLLALAFWSISQVGKVFSLASENLTLAAYYHSDFYVPKELVSTQLDNILRFTRTHSAPTLT